MMMHWMKRPHGMRVTCERDAAGREGHCVEGLVSIMTVLLLLLLMMMTTTMMMTMMSMPMTPTTLMFEMHHH